MTESKDIVWSEKLCKDLIREYKNRSVLWDCNNPIFYRQPQKMAEWEKIGNILNLPGDHCKHKMTILLSSFRREKAKCRKLKKSGKPYKSSWFAFNDLLFLLKRENLDPNISSCGKDPIGNEDSFMNYHDISSPTVSDMQLDQDDTSEYVVKVEPESDSESVTSIRTEDNRPGPSNLMQNRVIQSYSVQTSTEPDNTEEIVAFTIFIQAKLKKYSNQTMIAVQRDICDIIFNADRGSYEESKKV